jgi:uncharacterized protein (DUF169 family)
MDYGVLAQEITSKLSLASPPIAIAFVETAPAGIPTFDQAVPSACTFWRRAEAGVFYASAEQHFNCPVGAMVMGFEMPEAVQQQLMGFVEKMCGCGYLSPEEPAKIPTVTKRKSGIVYGPLKDFPIEPDVVLMWLTPRQAMLVGETVGATHWTEAAPSGVLGRPGCAALPIALEQDHATFSLGCMGMRTFTDVSEDRLLVALPGKKLQEFDDALASNMDANEEMRAFYEGHKAQFAQ